MNSRYLTLSWSTSRGRDTYGYNICRLDDPVLGKRYRCNGGGYDMTGTVVADWLMENYQERLLVLAPRASAVYADGKLTHPHAGKDRLACAHDGETLYGVYYYPQEKRISMDGACGINSVEHVARAIGITLEHTCNRKGHCLGFIVRDFGSEAALLAERNAA